MNRIDDITLARYLAGEMNATEEIAFRKDLEGNQEKMNELYRMEEQWKLFDESHARRSRDSNAAWKKLTLRLGRDGLLVPHPVQTGNRNLYRSLRIAASILLVLALGIPALYYGVIRNRQSTPEVNYISESGISTVDLPDGSRVTLNKGGSITFTETFNHERSVELSGEAYFEVMSDPQHPFTVHTGRVVVSVLGTSFNVKQADHSRDVEVYVTSGNVKIALENSENSITLVPGEMGSAGNQDLIKSIQNDHNYISWKTKEFKFVDTALEDVLAELEESYHVNINTSQADLLDMRITTTYSQQSIDAILETICTAFRLTVRLDENGYYLSN